MNRLSRTLAALLAALALRAAPPVLIDVDEANPPFMYAVGRQARGAYPELIRAAFKRMGLEVEIRPTPWKRAMEELETGQAGVGGLYKG